MTPQPGEQVLVVFLGTTEKIYHAGGHADGTLTEMLPVRHADGHLIYVPLVDGIAFLSGEQAMQLAAAVDDGRYLQDPGPVAGDCDDCHAAAGEYCAVHAADKDRAETYRRILLALAEAGLDPEAAGT